MCDTFEFEFVQRRQEVDAATTLGIGKQTIEISISDRASQLLFFQYQ